MNRQSICPVFVLTLLTLLTACGQGVEKAEEAVGLFRARRAASDFGAIYAETTDGFRAATSADQFEALLAGLDDKLGMLRTSTLDDWTVFYGTDGARMTLHYTSEFEKGQAREVFVWHFAAAAPLLHEYRIDLSALVMQ